ncbi:MAG: hypothetical protein BWY77_01519 [bacterium ADurb.Bin431]|nr:MAG: hypothetical protein BWY77_01519 [bacterium ADurb.Bin431]
MGADHLEADGQGGQAEPEGVFLLHHFFGEEEDDRNQHDGEEFGVVAIGGESDELGYKDDRQA